MIVQVVKIPKDYYQSTRANVSSIKLCCAVKEEFIYGFLLIFPSEGIIKEVTVST